jgi:hypothetical protein
MGSLGGEARTSSPHGAVVESLARELNVPIERVEKVYIEQINALQSIARIRNFVTVLAVSEVRRALRSAQVAS